jgi:hypothetical protein
MGHAAISFHKNTNTLTSESACYNPSPETRFPMAPWKKILLKTFGVGVGIGVGIAASVALAFWYTH